MDPRVTDHRLDFHIHVVIRSSLMHISIFTRNCLPNIIFCRDELADVSLDFSCMYLVIYTIDTFHLMMQDYDIGKTTLSPSNICTLNVRIHYHQTAQ